MQVFTAGEQRIDTAIVFFCDFLSPRSIQLREKISSERVVYLHWFHHRRSKSLKEHILPHGATQDEKLLSTGGPLCFLLAHLSPSLAQAGVRDGGGDQQQELFSLFFCRFSFQNLVGAVYPAALLKIEAPECSDPHFGPCSLRPSISLLLFLELANGWIDFLGSNPLSQSSSRGVERFRALSSPQEETKSIRKHHPACIARGRLHTHSHGLQKKYRKEFAAKKCVYYKALIKRHTGPASFFPIGKMEEMVSTKWKNVCMRGGYFTMNLP